MSPDVTTPKATRKTDCGAHNVVAWEDYVAVCACVWVCGFVNISTYIPWNNVHVVNRKLETRVRMKTLKRFRGHTHTHTVVGVFRCAVEDNNPARRSTDGDGGDSPAC